MADEHPLEQLLRDAKQKDDAKAVALAAERREALDLLKAWGTGHPGGIGTSMRVQHSAPSEGWSS